jgi:hypothetical protein
LERAFLSFFHHSKPFTMNHPRAEIHPSFSKPPRLIESVSTDPIRVIQEVFNFAFVEDLLDDLLPKWLRTALVNEHSIYTNTEHRNMLLAFYDQLILLAEAMQVISEKHKPKQKNALVTEPGEGKQPALLTEEQIANPLLVIAAFRKQFTQEYVRRELWHFLEAGVIHSGDFPSGFAPGYALMAYDLMMCLTEAAYCIGD